MNDLNADKDAVWSALVEEHSAFWMGDHDRWSRYYVHGEDTWFWGYARTGGVAIRRGWPEISRRGRENMADFARPSPRFAHETKHGDVTIHIRGNVAWVTFTEA